jgi:hypothetical protein
MFPFLEDANGDRRGVQEARSWSDDPCSDRVPDWGHGTHGSVDEDGESDPSLLLPTVLSSFPSAFTDLLVMLTMC